MLLEWVLRLEKMYFFILYEQFNPLFETTVIFCCTSSSCNVFTLCSAGRLVHSWRPMGM